MAKSNQYEAMFLLGPVGTTEPERATNLCRGVIEKHGGQIMVIKRWDERKLAYEVGGQKRGTYVLAFFRSPGSAVAGIERDVRLSEEILRAIVLRADHLNEQEMAAAEPQPVQPPREERPGYERGPSVEGAERPARPARARREEHREEAHEEHADAAAKE